MATLSTLEQASATKRPWTVRAAVGLVSSVGALAALAELISAWMTLTGRYLWTGGGADPRKAVEELPQLLQAEVREGRSLFLEDLPFDLRLTCSLTAVLAAITFVAAAILLVRTLLRIADGDAFGSRTRRTLFWLAAVLLGGGVLQGIADTVAVGSLVAWSITMNDAGPSAIQALGIDLPHWPVMLLVLGSVVAALSVAFRQGARIQDELAGVV